MKVLQISLLLAFIVIANCQDNQLNSSEYILYGYNMLHANPVPTALDALQDNGWMQPIFDDDTKWFTETAHLQQKTYTIPKGTYVQPNLSCSSTHQADHIENTSSYQKTLKNSQKVNGVSLYGSFSASRSFESVSKETRHSDKQIIQSVSKCLAYSIGVYDGDLPPLSQGFINSLKRLPLEYNQDTKQQYLIFFEMFGTHYPKKVSMGALVGESSTYLKEDLDKLRRKGVSIDATANLIAEGGEGGGSFASSKQQEEMEQMKSMQKNTQKVSYGTFIPDKDDQNAWMEKILQKQPMPILTEFNDLSMLLLTQINHPHFEAAGFDIKNVIQWGNNIRKGLLQYCVNANNGDEEQCKVYEQAQTCSLCQQRCGGKYPYDGGSFDELYRNSSDKKSWVEYAETFGRLCKNKTPMLAKENKQDSVKICCAQPYKKNDLNVVNYPQPLSQAVKEELEQNNDEYEETSSEEEESVDEVAELIDQVVTKSTGFLKNIVEETAETLVDLLEEPEVDDSEDLSEEEIAQLEATVGDVNNAKGQCRLCNSCGNGYNFKGGSMKSHWTMRGKWKKKHWYGSTTKVGYANYENNTYQYGDKCSGSGLNLQKGKDAVLCCKDESPSCEWCSTCGQDYPITKGNFRFDLLTTSVQSHYWWETNNSFKAKGKECSGNYASKSVNKSHSNYSARIHFCCKNAQIEVPQN